jgi:5-formyltetrahydrofolate cyclo-ligase
MEMILESNKKDLRKTLLAQLLALTDFEIKRRSKDVQKQLSQLPIYKQAKTIMAYYPLKGEVSVLELIGETFSAKRFCFPVMDLKAKTLRAFKVNSFDSDFVKGPYSVREPDLSASEEVDIKEIDMVIVPGLAFSKNKDRLGRGAGFYDRFISTIPPSAKTVGLAFDFQIFDGLPVDPAYDRKVNIVVSEHEII